uniref:Synaptonemal complex protein 2 armadillo-repeat-like domain-containing protein n=1 Tax=Eptatretus burgeri TaxID=7764 RepID=A0A8C4N516_EPTBU
MEEERPIPALTFCQAIDDALKGCGFQNVEKCLEYDPQDVDFTCDKQLLNNLDKLVHKELDKNQFCNIVSLLKCVLQCCNMGACSFGALFKEGIISKAARLGGASSRLHTLPICTSLHVTTRPSRDHSWPTMPYFVVLDERQKADICQNDRAKM